MNCTRNSIKRWIAVSLTVIGSTSAVAKVDENDRPGKDTLQVVQEYFDVRVKDINSPGNSARVEVRPRNNNCVGGGANPVTNGTFYNQDPDAINNAIETSLAQPVLHNNPACFSDRWGYFTTGTSSEGMSTYVLHGTIRSYTVQVTVGKNSSGQRVITRLRTDAK